ESMKVALGCSEVGCMAEIGGALGVERMIAGTVAKLGEAYVVNLQLINVVYGSVENRVSMRWEGPEIGLVGLLGAAAQDLVTPLAEKKTASLELTQLPEGADVLLDNERSQGQIENLSIGPHVVRITADGHEPKTLPFVAKSGQALVLDGSLTPVEQAEQSHRPLSVGIDFQIGVLTDIFREKATNKGPVMVTMLIEGSYRFHRWVRAGLRAGGDFREAGPITTSTPWSNASQVGKGGIFGAYVSTSPLYREDVYDVSAELGIDLHIRKITIASHNLPTEYSIGEDDRLPSSPKQGPLLGWHLGVSTDYCLTRAFSVGLGLRYYWVSGHTIKFGGKELHRSPSALAISTRLALRF
ncbi:hypothetical protein ACFL6C_14470, partial [Myxococcota bacterium]